jgi:hypothetical protein
VTSGDHENIVLHQLARLYQTMEQSDAAFSCFKQNLERMDQQGTTGQVLCSSPTWISAGFALTVVSEWVST